MSYGGPGTLRKLTANGLPKSLAGWFATIGEVLGLLNKGSAKAPAAPSDATNVQPVSSNTLNVTRVGGVASLISAAGGAALLIFNVNKVKDRAPIVVAAYLSIGVIVASALVTVAIIIAADIRARSAIAVAVSPSGRTDAKQVRSVSAAAPAGGIPQNTVVALDRVYEYVLVDAAQGDVLIALPAADSAAWQQMTIRREDNTDNEVTLRPEGAETISGQQQAAVAGDVQIFSDGQAWRVMQ